MKVVSSGKGLGDNLLYSISFKILADAFDLGRFYQKVFVTRTLKGLDLAPISRPHLRLLAGGADHAFAATAEKTTHHIHLSPHLQDSHFPFHAY